MNASLIPYIIKSYGYTNAPYRKSKKEILAEYKRSSDTIVIKKTSKPIFYKWLNSYKEPKTNLVDIMSTFISENSLIALSLSDVIINIKSNYDESLLLNVIRSLKKL